MSLFFLYIEYFKIGIFALGGGYATLPFLFEMANNSFTFIQKTDWLFTEQITNFIAIAQCSPGAIGVNVAAQIGYVYGGIAGGILAVLGLISPAIIIISIIAGTLESIKKNKYVIRIFSALRPAAAGLLAAAGWGLFQITFYNTSAQIPGTVWYEALNWKECLISLVLFILIIKLKWHPIIFIGIGAVSGIVLGFS